MGPGKIRSMGKQISLGFCQGVQDKFLTHVDDFENAIVVVTVVSLLWFEWPLPWLHVKLDFEFQKPPVFFAGLVYKSWLLGIPMLCLASITLLISS